MAVTAVGRYPQGWSAVNPVVMTVMLVTKDGVPIDAVHLPPEGRPEPDQLASGRRDLALVIAHGFTMTWQRPMIWKLLQRFNHHAGVITFDFRGHGRSGGLSTLGDKEIDDLDVAVRYAHELGYQRVVTIGFSMGGSVVLRQAALRGGVDAVISVSGPGRWFYRGTLAMRRRGPPHSGQMAKSRQVNSPSSSAFSASAAIMGRPRRRRQRARCSAR